MTILDRGSMYSLTMEGWTCGEVTISGEVRERGSHSQNCDSLWATPRPLPFEHLQQIYCGAVK
jgi:hypothetical protein